MKVLKEGTGQRDWAEEFTCTGEGNGGGGCKAVLLVERRDLFRTMSSIMGREVTHYCTFKCCECGVLTDIPKPIFWASLPSKKLWEER